MIIIRYVSLATALTVLLGCAVIGSWAAPKAAIGVALLAYVLTFVISDSLFSRRHGSSVKLISRMKKVSVYGVLAASTGTVAVLSIVGIFAICGPAGVPVTLASSLIAAVPLWQWWGRHRVPTPIIHIVAYRSPRKPPGRARRTRHPRPDRAATAHTARDHPAAGLKVTVADLLAEMTTDQLCRAWRRSWLDVLDRVRDPSPWGQLAELRRGYLEELARRDPGGVARWLASGARAGGDPSKFLTTRTRHDAASGEGSRPGQLEIE